MKDLFVWLVGLTMILFVVRYVYQIWKHQIDPTASTWIIFFFGVVLSFITYIIAEKHDFRSGILNTLDVVNVTIIIAVIILSKKKIKFEKFEKWYLLGVAIIIVYGFISKNVWNSNLFTQVLLCIGYAPTMHKLLKKRKNLESFTTWGISLLAGIFALYPALVDGNFLAIVYAIRNIILVSILLAIMFFYEFYSRKIFKNKKITTKST